MNPQRLTSPATNTYSFKSRLAYFLETFCPYLEKHACTSVLLANFYTNTWSNTNRKAGLLFLFPLHLLLSFSAFLCFHYFCDLIVHTVRYIPQPSSTSTSPEVRTKLTLTVSGQWQHGQTCSNITNIVTPHSSI